MHSENLKKVLIGSVMLFFVVTLFIHSKISEIQQKGQNSAEFDNDKSRGVASLGDSTDMRRNVQWEHELAHELAISNKINQASAKASSPSLLDKLMTENLGGEYSVQFKSGKISSIELNGEHPVVVKDYLNFMKEYAPLWSVGFDSIEQKNNQNEIQLKLFDKEHKQSGQATVKLDSSGRLMSMTLE